MIHDAISETYNRGHNILELADIPANAADILVNVSFARSETESDYY